VIYNSKNLLANPVFGNFHSTTSAKQFSSFMYFFHARLITNQCYYELQTHK
jgi:hypothetical protein